VLAALFAVTTQAAALDALRIFVAVIVHPVPVTEKVNAPDPEPPVVARVMAVPAVPVSTELLISKGSCATGLGTNDAVPVPNNKVTEPRPAEVTFAGVDSVTRDVRI
jgi:hypothetical protein